MPNKEIPTSSSAVVSSPQNTKNGGFMERVLALLLKPSFKLLWAPVAHFICCLALSLTMIFALDEYHAVLPYSNRRANGGFKLKASDVQTLISMALTVIKIIVSVWTGIILWNCVYILLRQSGLDVNQVQRVLSFYLPPFRRAGSVYLVGLLLLLAIPQQLIGPLISGATDWGYGWEFQPDAIQVQAGDPYASHSNWYWYGVSMKYRKGIVRRAAAFASLAWDNSTLDEGHCRHMVNDLSGRADPRVSSAVNSTAANVLMPCIQIHSIDFPSSPPSTDVWKMINDSVTGTPTDHIGRVKDSPLAYSHEGNAVLFDAQNWPETVFKGFSAFDNHTLDAPSSYKQTGLMTAAVILNGDYPRNGKHCADIGTNSTFGPTKYNNIFSIEFDNEIRNHYVCMTYAVVNLTAGVSVSPSSTYISARVLQADMPASQMEVMADPWVHEAIYLMPNVMNMVSQMNSTPLNTWGKLEDYMAKLIRYSYQGAWDALSRSYAPNDSTIPVRLYEPRQVAIVSHSRTYSWLAVSLLLQVSCFVLIVGSRFLKRKNVVDGSLAALLTDPTALYDKIEERFDLSCIDPTVSDKMGTINLQVGDDQGYRLVPKDQ